VSTQVSTADKVKVLQRELAMRNSVYPRRVRRQEMSQLEADYQIEVMQAILNDYLPQLKYETTQKPFDPGPDAGAFASMDGKK
jgi:hypothetical protein